MSVNECFRVAEEAISRASQSKLCLETRGPGHHDESKRDNRCSVLAEGIICGRHYQHTTRVCAFPCLNFRHNAFVEFLSDPA